MGIITCLDRGLYYLQETILTIDHNDLDESTLDEFERILNNAEDYIIQLKSEMIEKSKK